MYLDSDIILALIKETDWLKEYIVFEKLKPARTSVFVIIECQLILERDYSRKDALAFLSKVNELGIEIIPVDKKLVDNSQELREKYSNLNIFDSIHGACAIIHNEVLISTDKLFSKIKELNSKDPRYFKKNNEEENNLSLH